MRKVLHRIKMIKKKRVKKSRCKMRNMLMTSKTTKKMLEKMITPRKFSNNV